MQKQKKSGIMPEERINGGDYIGAEWIGSEGLMSPTLGKMEKGKVYQIDEAQAKISSGFKPLYN